MTDETVSSTTEESAQSDDRLRAEWDAVDADPDLEADLGYDAVELDVLVTSNSDKKVMVLPQSEDWVEDDAYIIAGFDLACDPLERA